MPEGLDDPTRLDRLHFTSGPAAQRRQRSVDRMARIREHSAAFSSFFFPMITRPSSIWLVSFV